MGNGSGSYRSSTENSMRAFDKLPRSARAALAEAAFDWATQPFLTAFNRGRFRTGKELAAYIKKIDPDQVAKRARKTYGADHPQAGKLPSKRGKKK